MKKVWERWKQVAHLIGDFQARLILTVLYFVAVAPFALLVRFGADPLTLKVHQRGWRVKEEGKGTAMNRALTQF